MRRGEFDYVSNVIANGQSVLTSLLIVGRREALFNATWCKYFLR